MFNDFMGQEAPKAKQAAARVQQPVVTSHKQWLETERLQKLHE
jgi:hypothetical protein